MAISSQINIAVDSKEFLALKAAFDKYEAALNKMPSVWQNVGKASSSAKTNFESIAENVKILSGSIAGITASSKEFFQVTTATARHWRDLAISTKDTAKHIGEATKSLLKWTGIISFITGGAGLFGLDRLVHSVSSQRQAALSTGGAYDARKAFLTNFRRFGDPEGMLAKVALAQADARERKALFLLGITKEELDTGDPVDIQIKAMRAGVKRAQEDKRTGRAIGSDPFLQHFTLPERRMLQNQPEEVETQAAKMAEDRKRFHLDPEDQKAYQDFTDTLTRAKNSIETSFVKGLVELKGPLTDLSESVVKLVDKFAEKALPAFIDDLASGIEGFAKEVGDKSFVEKVESFVGMIGSLAVSFGGMLGGLARFAHLFGIGSGTPESSWVAGERGVSTLTGAGGETSLEGRQERGGRSTGRFTHGGHVSGSGGHVWGGKAPVNTAAAMAAAKDQLRKEGVPEANLDAAAAALVGNAIAESGLDPTKVHDQGTGYGIYGARLERRTEMFNWLAAHGYAKNSFGGQQRQMAHAAMTDPKYSATRRALMNATDPSVAGDVVEHDFERPKVDNNRHAAFRKAFEARKVTVQSVPGGNTSLGSAAAAAGSP